MSKKITNLSDFRKVGDKRAPTKEDKDGRRLDGIAIERVEDRVMISWARPATSIKFKVHEAIAFANEILNQAGILTVSNPPSPPDKAS